MPDKQQYSDQQIYEGYLKTASKQAGMVFSIRVIGYLLGFFTQAIFARFLGPDNYGLFSLGLTVANVGVLFGTFGMQTGMTKFLGEYIGNKEYAKAKGTLITGFKWTIILSSIAAIVLFLFREPIAIRIFKEERLIPLLPWFSMILVLLALINLLNGILRGFKKPSVFTFYKEIIERLVRIGIFIVLFFLGIQLLGVVIATLVSSIVVVFRLVLWLYRKGKVITNKEIKASHDTKSVMLYSSNMLFVSFTYFLMGQVNRLIIGGFLDSKQVGLYSISDTVAHLGVFFGVAFTSIFAPIISEVFHKGKIKMLSNLYTNITRWITTLSIPLVLWIIAFSDTILSVFGNDFIAAKFVLIVLAIGQFVNAATGPCGNILIMTKYQRYEMINGLLTAGINIGLNFLLIPYFGILGSALAGGVALSVVNLAKVLEVYFLLKIQPYDKKFMKLIIPSAMSIVLLMVMKRVLNNLLGIVLGLISGMLLFLIILFILGLPVEDKIIINAIIKRMKRTK